MAATILFSSKTPAYAWLSNFHAQPFTLDGVRWPSVEHYYQAQKYAGSPAADRIRKAESPLKARKAGQDRSLVPRADWLTAKLDVMRRAARAKFEQNRRLQEQLLATGDAELIHQSTSDLFWGRSADGQGENRLGVILMEIRTELGATA
jgi:ribA/ribD-fused uncharacterized protein